MKLRTIKKDHAADREIGFLTKLISKPFGHADSDGVNIRFFVRREK